jgi:hypothetical protein
MSKSTNKKNQGTLVKTAYPQVSNKELSENYKQFEQKPNDFNKTKIAENGGKSVMEGNDLNNEVQKYFGDKFTATQTMGRFDVMIDHFSKKFSISHEQAKEAYEKTQKLHDEGKIEKFSGYFAAICKSMSTKEYSPEQNRKYIEYNVRQRKDEQLIDFMQKYESGIRRVFAPHFGISKKEHNDMAYEAAKLENEVRI